jgi:hypothetical protein
MKTLKLTLSIFALFLITFIGCKKEKNEPQNTALTIKELLEYNIRWILMDPDNKSNIRILYFNKVGSELKATLDGVDTRVVQTIKLVENGFTFDLNGDGTVVYTLKLARTENGELKVIDNKFYNINNPAYRISEASTAMFKTSLMESVKNKTFADRDVILKFNVDTWLYGGVPNVTGTFYEIPGGWKGRLNGVDYMGLCVPINGELALGFQNNVDKYYRSFFTY